MNILDYKDLCWFISSFFFTYSKNYSERCSLKENSKVNTKENNNDYLANELISILKEFLNDYDIRIINTFIRGSIDELKNEKYDFSLSIANFFVPVLVSLYRKILEIKTNYVSKESKYDNNNLCIFEELKAKNNEESNIYYELKDISEKLTKQVLEADSNVDSNEILKVNSKEVLNENFKLNSNENFKVDSEASLKVDSEVDSNKTSETEIEIDSKKELEVESKENLEAHSKSSSNEASNEKSKAASKAETEIDSKKDLENALKERLETIQKEKIEIKKNRENDITNKNKIKKILENILAHIPYRFFKYPYMPKNIFKDEALFHYYRLNYNFNSVPSIIITSIVYLNANDEDVAKKEDIESSENEYIIHKNRFEFEISENHANTYINFKNNKIKIY